MTFEGLTWTERGSGTFKPMKNDYLHKEYELCFEQLRFYDERQINLLKFLFSLTSAVAAAQFALYKLFGAPTKDFHICLAFLAIIVFVGSQLVYLSMVQNRLYFVFTARQINALRRHLLREEAPSFAENQLYTKTDFSAIKPFSVHTYLLLGSAFITSLFGGVFVYGLCQIVIGKPCWCTVTSAYLLLTIALTLGGYFYLKTQGARRADEAVHQETKEANKPVDSTR